MPCCLRSCRPGVTTGATLLYLAYAPVYLIWGSTFFAIRIGIESLPPLLLPALRHLSIGLIFYPIFRYLSKGKPTLPQWRTAVVTGCLLLSIGNGTVSWAEKIFTSGIAARLVATVSLWMVLIDWPRPGGSRPGPRVIAGLVLGFAGLGLLVGPKDLDGSDRINPFWDADSGDRLIRLGCRIRLFQAPCTAELAAAGSGDAVPRRGGRLCSLQRCRAVSFEASTERK
jgi:drug/metabolite transporter (DMT)-like permease